MTNEEKKNVEIVKFDTPYTNAISRQAAIDAMREETCLSCWDAKYILENLPSVSTEKTGRWIETSGVDMFVCSVCNDSFYPMPTCMGKPLMKYCPNCGAKMEGHFRVVQEETLVGVGMAYEQVSTEKTGYWIKIKPYPLQMHDYECSECKHETDDNTEKYCSECGCRILGVEE